MGGSTKPRVEAICRDGAVLVLEPGEGVVFLISRAMDLRVKSHLCVVVSSNIDVSGHIGFAWEDRNGRRTRTKGINLNLPRFNWSFCKSNKNSYYSL